MNTRKRKREKNDLLIVNQNECENNQYYEFHILMIYIGTAFKKLGYYVPKELLQIIIEYRYLPFHTLVTNMSEYVKISANGILAKSIGLCTICYTKLSILESALPLTFCFAPFKPFRLWTFGIWNKLLDECHFIRIAEKQWQMCYPGSQLVGIMSPKPNKCLFEMKYILNVGIAIYLNQQPLKYHAINNDIFDAIIKIPTTFELAHTHYFFELYDHNQLILINR